MTSHLIALASIGFLKPLSISKNTSFHGKHLCVLVGSDSSDRSLNSLMENHTLPIAQATEHSACLPSFLWAWNARRCMHHQNNISHILFAEAALMLQLYAHRLVLFLPFVVP